MPELPEVENVKLQLNKYLRDHVFENVQINYQKCFQGDSKSIVGGKFVLARRFGKVLSLDLDNAYSLVIHIKLTGQLIYRGPNLRKAPNMSKKVTGGIPGKHTHVVFQLDRGGKLYYNDVRKFGWIKVVKTNAVENIDFIKKLGPEPFGSASGKSSRRLTSEKFKELTSSTKRSIKTLIMDQSKIGGVGNIYANDALFLAKIHPERKANSLSSEKITKLFGAIEKVLLKGLETGGASELAFVTPDGAEGAYQNHTLIYGKDGEKCPNKCGEVVKKKMVAGRGTYFCPKCQE